MECSASAKSRAWAGWGGVHLGGWSARLRVDGCGQTWYLSLVSIHDKVIAMNASSQGHDPQLLRGVLPLLILTLLDERESYGYELVERLRALGLTELATGVVYPVLNRFERDGLVDSRLVPSSSGPARKYYAITPYGRTTRADAVGKWQEITAVTEHALTIERTT